MVIIKNYYIYYFSFRVIGPFFYVIMQFLVVVF